MSRIDIEQATVHERIVTLLQLALEKDDRTCYPVARSKDVPIIPPGGDFFVTVAMEDGTFTNSDEQITTNVTEETALVVSAYTRVRLDSTSHDRSLLWDDARGLLRLKKLILAALVGQDLTDADGNTFLRQWCYAVRTEGPDIVEMGRGDGGLYLGVIRVTFAIQFDWDLTLPGE